jgi:hypothetical protein
VKLVALFEGELIYDESTETGIVAYGESGDIASYAQGGGHVDGPRLTGKLRWTNHPRRRADGVALPYFHGVLSTADGAEILFSFRGYNWGVVKAAKDHHPLQPFERRAGLAALTLAAGDERYRWVNRVFAMLEADIVPYAAPELWRVRAFECVNDLVEAPA